MAFPTNTTLLDDFNRADGPIGSAWTWGVGDGEISTNQAHGTGAENFGRYASPTFNEDQEAFVTISVKGTTEFDRAGVTLRAGAGPNGYLLYYSERTAATDVYRIGRFDAGVYVDLANVTGPELTAGDKIGGSAFANTITLYLFNSGSWTQILSVIDSTYVGPGLIGFYSIGTTAMFEDFSGGNSSSNVVMLPMGMLGTGRV